MKNLNILLALIVVSMLVSAIGCDDKSNPISAVPSERIIYYAEINDTMTYARDSGYYIDTLYGDFDFTKSDSIKIEFTYLTNVDWGYFNLQGTHNDTLFYYFEMTSQFVPSISDSTFHTASKHFKSYNQKFNKMRLEFRISYYLYLFRYTILKDIKITELK